MVRSAWKLLLPGYGAWPVCVEIAFLETENDTPANMVRYSLMYLTARETVVSMFFA